MNIVEQLTEILPRLARHLPIDVFNPLRDQLDDEDNIRVLQKVVRALESLHQVLVNYTPRYLIEVDFTPGEPYGEMLEGAFVFADVTGFTALTEMFSRQGYGQGQETISYIMNRFFAHVLDPLVASGGDLLIFAGDAVLAYFPHQEDGEDVLQATRAALRMQRAIHPFIRFETELGPASLTMSVGVERGAVYAGIVGTPERMELLISGPATEEAMIAESRAEPKQVALGPQAAAIARPHFTLDGQIVVDDLGEALGAYEISLPTRKRGSAVFFSLDIAELLEALQQSLRRVERLALFLPEDILARLVNMGQQRHLPPELRPVAVQFINLIGLERLAVEQGPEIATAVFQRYFVRAQQIVTRHEGVISQIDAYHPGFFFLNTFGAPRAHEGTRLYAVSAALQLGRLVEQINREFELDPPLQQRGGITYGLIFTGEVGAVYRRESVVVGSSVNRAARLMSQAEPGQIILDADIWAEVQTAFVGEQLPAVQLKGIEGKVTIIEVQQMRLGARLPPLERPLIGREMEQAQLETDLQKLLNGAGCVRFITGETGLGKTTLIRYLADTAREQKLMVLVGRCQPHGAHIPLLPWLDLLRGWLEMDRTEGIEERFHHRLADLYLSEFGTVLAELLLPASQPSAPDSDSASFDPRLIITLLSRLVRQQPLVIILEDIHWLDKESQALLEALLAEISQLPMLLVVTGREPVERTAHTPLTKLPATALLQIAQRTLGAESLDDSLGQWIAEKCAGNPYYAVELCRALQQANAVLINKNSGVAYWTKAAPDLPLSLHALLLARLEELPLLQQDLLKRAAVFGPIFEYEGLRHLFGKSGAEAQFQTTLEQVVQTAFVAPLEEGVSYQFTHALMQEAIYETLSFARRKQWHTQIGDWLAAHRLDQEQNLALTAYHYLRGDDPLRAAHFARRAGDKARMRREYTSALEYYGSVLSLAQTPEDEERMALAGQAEVLAIQGDYSAARLAYGRAAELGSADARQKEAILSGELVQLDRLQFSDALLPWARGGQAWLLARQGKQPEAVALLRETISTCSERNSHKTLTDLQHTLENNHRPGPYEKWIDQFVAIVLQCGFSPIDLLEMSGQFSLLMQHIIRHNGLTLRQAAEICHRSVPEIERILEKMVKKGYLHRVKRVYKARFGHKSDKKLSADLWAVLDNNDD